MINSSYFLTLKLGGELGGCLLREVQSSYTGPVANILDVAKLAGVSPTTAKRALREPGRLHPDTLERVMSAVAALHYEPDQRAGALRGGQSRAVGLLVGSIVEPFFAELARTTGRTLRRAGYTLIISENEYSSERDLEELKLLYGQRVSALIVRPGYGERSREYLMRLRERGVYIVEVDYHLPDAPFNAVMLDNPASVRQGVRYLHEMGHTRIAALGTYHPLIHAELRSKTFPLAMLERGLSVPPEYQRVTLLNEETAYILTHELMSLPSPPTALFALNGTQAVGAYRALRERGLKLARDVSLLTFDDYPWMSLVDPSIDAIKQPVQQMGEAAAQLVVEDLERRSDLDSLLESELLGAAERVYLEFSGQLIRRGSCAPPSGEAVPDGVASSEVVLG